MSETEDKNIFGKLYFSNFVSYSTLAPTITRYTFVGMILFMLTDVYNKLLSDWKKRWDIIAADSVD